MAALQQINEQKVTLAVIGQQIAGLREDVAALTREVKDQNACTNNIDKTLATMNTRLETAESEIKSLRGRDWLTGVLASIVGYFASFFTPR